MKTKKQVPGTALEVLILFCTWVSSSSFTQKADRRKNMADFMKVVAF